MEKQTEKQVDALKSLNLSNKINELKRIEGIFPKILLNYLIINKLKEFIKLQDITNTDDVYYKWSPKKIIILVNILYQLFFKRYLSLKDADDEQIKFVNELKSIDNGPKSVEKKLFMNNVVLFLTAREKVLNNFENRLFPIENLEQELEPEL